MGNSSSPAAPPPSTTFSEPWRNISWDKQNDLRYVKAYQPGNSDIRHLRILLYGPVKAGKSSFINSVSNVMQGRMSIPALASASVTDKSFTTRFRTHQIKKGNGTPRELYPFVFNDIMGLEDGASTGVLPEDIKLAMKGHVKDNYKFNPVSPLSEGDQFYEASPSSNDKVHVLVCVLSANESNINPSVLQKMVSIREAASDLGIPQMAILTKIDGACPEIEEDLKNVYKSKHLKKKMKDFSAEVGIPMNCIFPVKNYCDEIAIDDKVDALILSALRQMIDFGDDFTDNL